MSSTQDLLDALGPVGLDDAFFGQSLTDGHYGLITAGGVDCYASYSAGGPGCPVAGDHYFFGGIDLTREEREPHVYFDLTGTAQVFADGSFRVDGMGMGTYGIEMEMIHGASTLDLTATFTDKPGYASVDALGRHRGGSTITLSYRGVVWVFEKQH
jgi:hypothetical protein